MAKLVVAAERLLRRCDTGAEVLARVYVPQLNDEPEADGEWRCDFEITGLEDPVRSRVLAMDSLQALLLGLASIRAALIDSSVPVAWYSNVPKDIGIPGFLPTGDPVYESLLQHLLEAERIRHGMIIHRVSRAERRLAGLEDEEEDDASPIFY